MHASFGFAAFSFRMLDAVFHSTISTYYQFCQPVWADHASVIF